MLNFLLHPPSILFLDLELGNVLLFPIDDKQSRLTGQDFVSHLRISTSSVYLNSIIDHLLHGVFICCILYTSARVWM